MKRTTRNLLRSLRSARKEHKGRYERLVVLREKIVAIKLSYGELVDVAYLLRELSKIFDDLRKEMDAVRDLAGKTVCLAWVGMSEADPETDRSVRGELALGTPDVKISANVPSPHKEPERYAALMDHLGIAPELHGVVRPHWPRFTEYVSKLAAEGKPLPPGIDPESTYAEYKLGLRKLVGKNSSGEEV